MKPVCQMCLKLFTRKYTIDIRLIDYQATVCKGCYKKLMNLIYSAFGGWA